MRIEAPKTHIYIMEARGWARARRGGERREHDDDRIGRDDRVDREGGHTGNGGNVGGQGRIFENYATECLLEHGMVGRCWR